MAPLVQHLTPCGPVIDADAARRAHERLTQSAVADGWADLLSAAWPALAPVFAT